MTEQTIQNGKDIGLLMGKVEGVVKQLDLVLEIVNEIKQDNREHRELDQKYYEKVHELDGNQKKIIGIAAGIAITVGVGIEKVKSMLGWG